MGDGVDGKKIQQLREARVLERKELAELAGVGYTTIYKMEAHDHQPRLRTVRAVAKVLKTAPDNLLKSPMPIA